MRHAGEGLGATVVFAAAFGQRAQRRRCAVPARGFLLPRWCCGPRPPGRFR